MIRILGIALALFMVSVVVPPAEARYAALIADADTGQILHSVNADTRNYPASLTKIMTLYMVFDALERGKIKPDQRLKVSARAARQPASKLGLGAGQTITVREAIAALVTKSANDVATVVAEALGGSERKFARLMTAKAQQLGMSRTTFRNASGLPNRGQLSTARDMLRLAQALRRDFPRYYHHFSRTSFSYKGARHRNHNRLLTNYDGVDGIKTGYIRASGFNVVISAKRGQQRLIGVVFGGRTARSRDQHMAKLLDRGFTKLAAKTSRTRVAKAAPAAPAPKAQPSSGGGLISAAHAAMPPRPAAKPKTATPAYRVQRWGVQLGAYSRFASAHLAATRAARRAPALLGKRVYIVRVSSQGRPLFKPRLLGMSETAARRSCNELKQRKISCAVMRFTPAAAARASS